MTRSRPAPAFDPDAAAMATMDATVAVQVSL